MFAEGASERCRPRVLAVGAGFAGINAAKRLAKLPVDVTVIDRTNRYTFQPLLYQVALAVPSPADIAQPIRRLLSGNTNTEVLMDEVLSIDASVRRLHLCLGAEMAYDYLVLATGSTHSYSAHPEWAALTPGLKQMKMPRRFDAACCWPLSSPSGRWLKPVRIHPCGL